MQRRLIVPNRIVKSNALTQQIRLCKLKTLIPAQHNRVLPRNQQQHRQHHQRTKSRQCQRLRSPAFPKQHTPLPSISLLPRNFPRNKPRRPKQNPATSQQHITQNPQRNPLRLRFTPAKQLIQTRQTTAIRTRIPQSNR